MHDYLVSLRDLLRHMVDGDLSQIDQRRALAEKVYTATEELLKTNVPPRPQEHLLIEAPKGYDK